MANRSNRRWQNPQVSRCVKHVEAIGSRRANSPSWPCIESMPKSEAEYTCAVGTGAKAKEACNEEESIYGRLRSENARPEANNHSRCPLEARPSFVRRPGKAFQRLATGGDVDVRGLRAHSSHLFQDTGVHRLDRLVDGREGIGDAPRSALRFRLADVVAASQEGFMLVRRVDTQRALLVGR